MARRLRRIQNHKIQTIQSILIPWWIFNAALKKWSQYSRTPGDYNQSRDYVQGRFASRRCKLLTINIGRSKDFGDALRSALVVPLQNLLGPPSGPTSQLINELLNNYRDSFTAPGSVIIDVNWLSDGVEILAGYAGVAQASGFLSLFGHRVKVDIAGTNVGNDLPASFLIGLSGYVNPVGPVFLEFRCGVVINADNDPIGVYGTWWKRDVTNNSGAKQLPAFTNDGWVINLETPTDYPPSF